VPALLAAVSALAFGVGDFLGGLSARRMAAAISGLTAQTTGFLLLMVAATVAGGSPGGTDWAWGMAAGASGAMAVVVFYWAMAVGQMSVVAPVSAVTAALMPFAFGLASGERPSAVALLGTIGALVAIVLISRERGDPTGDDERSGLQPRGGPVLAASLLSGVGFGGFLVFISRSGVDSGLWPVAAARAAAVVIVGAVTLVWRPGRPSADGIRLAVFAGAFDVTANSMFLVASRSGLLTLVGVIGSMYPASTVVLARWVLRERLAAHQLAGLGLAALSVLAIAMG